MHLLAEMRYEAAGRHRYRAALRIEFRTRADPPRALQDHDVAVVRVKMRPAEMIALGPFGVHHVEARLVRISDHDRVLCAPRIHRSPWDLVRRLVDDGRGIELGGRADAQHRRETDRQRESAPNTNISPQRVLPFVPRSRGVHDFCRLRAHANWSRPRTAR